MNNGQCYTKQPQLFYAFIQDEINLPGAALVAHNCQLQKVAELILCPSMSSSKQNDMMLSRGCPISAEFNKNQSVPWENFILCVQKR